MRILIATVTAGAGHLQAAAALEETWRTLHPTDEVRRVDLLSFVSPLQRKVYAEGYLKVVAHAPELWAFMFNKTDNPKLLGRLSRFRCAFARATNRRFVTFLRQSTPDVILCTHFLPLEVLGSQLATKKELSPLTACVVTDFEAHALWMAPGIDLYCVAAEETKARLVARGVAPDKVIATGIPVAQKFSRRPNSAAVRKAYGLRDDQPILLVLSGGFGMGPVAGILTALDQVEGPFQVLVVAGRNTSLRRQLAGQDRRHPTHVLGFVNNMHELMAVADLIITKPGGLTSSEALAMGKPMVVLDPIPGQEAANSDFLLEHGAAAKVNRIEDLPFRLRQLLGSAKLAALARAAKSLGRPQAATHICQAVIERQVSGPGLIQGVVGRVPSRGAA